MVYLSGMKKICLALIAVLLAGCATTGDIHEDPQKYAGKTVILTGKMTKRIPIPFTDLAVFVFEDGRGSALVLSGKEHVLDETVVLKGKVAVFPQKGANREMEDLVSQVKDFLIENGWAKEKNAENAAGAVVKVFAAVIKGLGKAFIILEPNQLI